VKRRAAQAAMERMRFTGRTRFTRAASASISGCRAAIAESKRAQGRLGERACAGECRARVRGARGARGRDGANTHGNEEHRFPRLLRLSSERQGGWVCVSPGVGGCQ
jgi:hypothetical protein